MRRTCIISAILATILSGTVALAQAQDGSSAQTSAPAQVDTTTHEGPTVGGHIGLAIPLVTESRGNWTNDAANQFAITFPVGITVKGSGRLAFDLELDPTINTTGTRQPLSLLHLVLFMAWDMVGRWERAWRST